MLIGGLDVGQAADYTVLSIVERKPAIRQTERRRWSYDVRYLQRWPLGTPYTQIATDLADLYRRPPLPWTYLAVDFTGVGRPVVETLAAARVTATIRPILITSGHDVGKKPYGYAGIMTAYHVPKKELITTLQVVFQARLIRIPRSLPLSDRLVRELSDFRVKITRAANEKFGAWADGQHDDMVLSLALAVWLSEANGCGTWAEATVQSPEDTLLASAPAGALLDGGVRLE
jgi:hypothetical protein